MTRTNDPFSELPDGSERIVGKKWKTNRLDDKRKKYSKFRKDRDIGEHKSN